MLSHIRGWINYYGRYYKSALYPALRHIDRVLARWAHRKFKSLRRHKRGHITGWSKSCAASPICSHTGSFSMDAAEQWEPDEARASRPVMTACAFGAKRACSVFLADALPTRDRALTFRP
jgi:hypothetical protein